MGGTLVSIAPDDQRLLTTNPIPSSGSSGLLARIAVTDEGDVTFLAQFTNSTGVLRGAPVPMPCGDIDFNNDRIGPDVQDIADFLTVYAGNPCPQLMCDPIDINRDGVYPDAADIDAFLSVFAGGGC
jgi:hypothetical protein